MEGARHAAAIEALKGQGLEIGEAVIYQDGRVQNGIRSGRTSRASGRSEATHNL